MSQPPQDSRQQGAPDATQPVRHRAYEGKSIELGIDVLLNQPQMEQKDLESSWSQKSSRIPDRAIWLGAVIVVMIAVLIFLNLQSNKPSENQLQASAESMIENNDARIHATLWQTVSNYLQSDRIESMLPLIRNAEPTRKRLEKYYASQPFSPQQCLSLEKVKPFFYKERQLWHVVAKIDQKTAVALMLEEIPDGRYLVDWESHVDYQPMPWEQYILEQPHETMAFRVTAESSNFYAHEFSDESRWVSYQLRQKNSEHMVHGYAPRDSELHKQMDKAVSEGPRRIILRLQTSKEFAARRGVVIKGMVSDSIYRIEPPTSLSD